jgi:hypothetical protein
LAAAGTVVSSSPTATSSGNLLNTASANTCRNVSLLSDVFVISSCKKSYN